MTTAYSLPKLALRIGVTGHREFKEEVSRDISIRLRAALKALKDALQVMPAELRNCYSSDPVILRAISPLAEGADRIFASEALALDYELECLLPFHRKEYCKDFSGEASIREFEEFLERAKAVFELDGARQAKPNAYESMGRLMLDQCDLLIAVYDDKRDHGAGGTAGIVDEAIRRQMPVIWIHPEQIPDRIINAGKNPGARILTPKLAAQAVHDLMQPPWLRKVRSTRHL
jgi:hypothetical protein